MAAEKNGDGNVAEYGAELVNYLRPRTGLPLNHFEPSEELRALMTRMDAENFPPRMWRMLLNSVTKLIADINENFSLEIFWNLFIAVIIEIVDFFLDYWVLKAAIILISMFPSEYLSSTLLFLYHVFKSLMQNILQWVAEKLKELYRRFRLEFQNTIPIMNS